MTFFPWERAVKGQIGGGQVGITSYAIPVGAMPFWEKRLNKFNIAYSKTSRFGEDYLQFSDYHGLILELVERDGGERNEWAFGEVTADVAIKGFAGAVLFSTDPQSTNDAVAKTMGLEKEASEDDLVRYRSSADNGNRIDIKQTAVREGRMGVGTVHHIAWRAKDKQEHQEWQEYVRSHNHYVTEVRDRNYFDAIYFREKGNILFEIATDTPGFAHDESYETMGSEIMLPAQYESKRAELTRDLRSFEVRSLD